jgi:N-formylglutamate amidohydrolase
MRGPSGRDPAASPTPVPPVLDHIPHSSTAIPGPVRSTLLLDDDGLRDELLRMTDRYTDELFGLPEGVATAVRYPVSRLVVDPERFEDDRREPMAARGMGVIYERTSRGAPLRHRPTPAEREELLAAFYRPHHERLAAEVGRILDRHDRCLIVDGHSFATDPLPHEPDQRPGRPDVCIGTDTFHTSPVLVSLAMEVFREQGFSVECDRPFQGSLVPAPFYQADRRVSSFMVEVRRGVYVDENSGEKLRTFDPARLRFGNALRRLVEEWV